MSTDDIEKSSRLAALAEGRQPRWLETPYQTLPPAEQVLRSIWELESEVNNGGFHQYFFNSSGLLAPFATGALREIGAHAVADLVSRAMECVGEATWRDPATRRQHLKELPDEVLDALDELDQAFYAYPDNLTALLYAYASDHRDELGAPAEF